MSSDDYFNDELDSGILNQLDAIEAVHRAPQPPKQPESPKDPDDSFFDLTLDIDEAEFRRLDTFIDAVYQGKAPPIVAPSNVTRSSSKNTVQTTLFGDVVQPVASSSKQSPASRTSFQRTKSASRNPFGQQAPQTKQWDHTAYAKSGWKKPKSAKGKGKDNAYDDEDDHEEESVEFEQFAAPFVSGHPPKPMKLKVDMLEAKHWIYPLNQPKRDYQFNIVRHCLFENTLVALPTGLGKTFIAGVVMLNFYRWFPEGKVVFVAPTKPLVAQQIDACHRTCGIPGRDAVELTGNNPRPYRFRMWEEKRVFYMTPQTLINDLVTENCDAQDIILMVIDEAHKGTGDYAYAQVVRYLMAKNPHFRVLALTATPGSTPEAIQAIVDSLHISRIEIRDEKSLDLREYMHKKEIKQHIINMTPDILKIQGILKTFMEATVKPLADRGIIEPVDVVKMHPYRAMATMQRLRGPSQKWAFAPLSKLSTLARAMGYLMEASVNMCYTCLQEMVATKEPEPGKKAKPQNKIGEDATYKQLMHEIESQRSRGLALHPKMETLKTLLVQHFGSRMAEAENEGEETRAMVFVTYRDCVDEIVEMLNHEQPLLKAMRFVGQGTDKQGRKGFAQKEQLEVIKKFKAGDYNVLVSTSIGEEGLDIGEVDMIICYDAQKTPIRMLQRVGRTGRRRDGYVHVLLSEVREELNWDKAQDTYGELQRCIVRGDQLELYGDVPRLLPDQVKPDALEKKMPIEEYIREEPTTRKKTTSSADGGGSPTKGKKRKRNDDIARNIPEGASTGFVSVAELVVKGAAKKRKTKPKVFDPLAADDDSTDMELESNLLDMRRTLSTSAAATIGSKGKGKLRQSKTIDPSKAKAPAARKKARTKGREATSASQFVRKGTDDEDDMDIELGISIPKIQKKTKSRARWSSSPEVESVDMDVETSVSRQHQVNSGFSPPYVSPSVRAITPRQSQSPASAPSKPEAGPSREVIGPTTPSFWSSSPKIVLDDEVIELTSSPSPSRSVSPLPVSPSKTSARSKDSGVGSSKSLYRDSAPPPPEPISPVITPEIEFGVGEGQSMAWLLDDDEDPEIQIVHSSPVFPRNSHSPRERRVLQDDSVEVLEEGATSPIIGRQSRKCDMPPPVLPCSQRTPMLSSDQEIPEASFAIRPAGKPTLKKRVLAPDILDSPLSEMPPPSQRRLQRRDTEVLPHQSSPAPRRRKAKRVVPLKHNPWVDGEAAHSGAEESEGSSHSEDDVESESDRQFLKDMATQASPSYDQALAYRQSLFTQAPARGGAPAFANGPRRRAVFFGRPGESAARRPMVSSSPPREDDEPDEYVLGSFVVDDEADISFE
ncbi:P-loop containing nucleoside triphosphate hydrolase protein [Leucogyrophana mollusca]|uniref:P-loop containing nucleoside triphosphate hydrolase protein n=1 Tax=Leucogyrophana mollusca TaxID=85980 RepID=A0ACB8B6P9_9AGAM|nr:P-loop containing nucleoside triphosphate hydrolase protein [Leucogyrophana mollusca]